MDREAIVQEVLVQVSMEMKREAISRNEFDGVPCERGHVSMEDEAERGDGEMQQMVPSLTNLGEQVVVLDDEDVGIDDPGAGAVLLTEQGEAGQQVEKGIIM